PDAITIPAGQSSTSIQVIPISDRTGNLHQYQIVSSANISWEQAREEAAQAVSNGVHGHLATITSEEEDARIDELREQAGGPVLWVGGYQEPGEQSITEGWKWVNNEGPIPGTNDGPGYANWLSG